MIKDCVVCGFRNDNADPATPTCPNCGAAYPTTTADSPTAITGSRGAATFMPPAPPPPPSRPYATPFAASPAPRQPNRRPLIIGIVVAAIVVAALGGGLIGFAASRGGTSPAAVTSPTATAVPGQNKAAQYQTYTDPNQLFTIKYPLKWGVTTATVVIAGANVPATTFAAKSAKATVAFTLAVGAFSLTPQTVGATLTSGAFTMTGQATTYVTKRTKITWQEVAGSATFSGGTGQVTFYWTTVNNTTYLVTYVNTLQSGVGGKIPELMLNSLMFGATGA